jgi:hypothetical protein
MEDRIVTMENRMVRHGNWILWGLGRVGIIVTTPGFPTFDSIILPLIITEGRAGFHRPENSSSSTATL